MGAGVHNWVSDDTASARRSLVESVLADEQLKERTLAHKLTTNDKRRIAQAYQVCFNIPFKKTCANCFEDAYYLIRNKNKNEIMDKCKYVLKNGAVIEWENKPYSNKNLTNKVAEAFMAKYPTNRFFSVAPTTEKKDLRPEAPKDNPFLDSNGNPLTGAALKNAQKKAAAAEEEAKRLAAEGEAKKLAAEEEAKRLAAEQGDGNPLE